MPTDAQNTLSPIFYIEERDVLCVGPPLHGAYGCTSRLKLRLLIADREKVQSWDSTHHILKW